MTSKTLLRKKQTRRSNRSRLIDQGYEWKNLTYALSNVTQINQTNIQSFESEKKTYDTMLEGYKKDLEKIGEE